MNSKKVNWMFLCTITIKLILMFGFVSIINVLIADITSNLIISELILLVPALIFVFAGRTKLSEVFTFRKIKITSVLMIILFVYLSMPLVTTINAFSMLFSENAVAGISTDVLEMPFLLMLFLMGIYGPVCEELVFRGIVHSGYRKSASALQAMFFSALLFGLMHMNFNQALYAFAIGFMLVLLKEATGSILAPIIYHVVFNSHTVVLMYIYQKWMPNIELEAARDAMDTKTLLTTMSAVMVVAAITTALGVCVLVWIANNENRKEYVTGIWTKRKETKGHVVTVPLIVSILLCFAFMIYILL